MADAQAGLSKKTIANLEQMDFSCQRCSSCCRHDEGFVFLTREDADAIAAHLHLSLDEFMKQCCRLVEQPEGKVLCLKEKTNYDCIFWSNGCLIYEVRPLQCKTFPYWPFLVNDKKLQEEERSRCKGLGIKGDHSLDYKIAMYCAERDAQYFVIKSHS